MKRFPLEKLVLAGCLAVFVAMPNTARANIEIGTYVESSWTGTPCAGASPKPSWLDAANAWRNWIYTNGVWDVCDSTVSNLYAYYFHDRTYDSYGFDHNYIDKYDLAMLLTHGGAGTAPNWEYTARMTFTSTGEDCHARQSKMVYGDVSGQTYTGDLEVLILPGCNGLFYCNNQSWKFQEYLHLINAFHGTTHTGDELDTHLVAFADDGYDESISDSWFSNLHYQAGVYWHCPVSIARADTVAHAQEYIFEETYYLTKPNYPPFTSFVRRKFNTCDPGVAGPTDGDTFANTDCGSDKSTGGKTTPAPEVSLEELAIAYEAIEKTMLVEPTAVGSEIWSLEAFANLVGVKPDETIRNQTNVKLVSYYDKEMVSFEDCMNKHAEKAFFGNGDLDVERVSTTYCSGFARFHKRIAKQDQKNGRLTYIDSLRGLTGELPTKEEAIDQAWRIFDDLGLSDIEVADVRADTVDLDAIDGSGNVVFESLPEKEIVSFERKVNGLKVDGAKFIVVVGHRGIEKIDVRWPALNIGDVRGKIWKEVEKDLSLLNLKTINYAWFEYVQGADGAYIPALKVIGDEETSEIYDEGAQETKTVFLAS